MKNFNNFINEAQPEEEDTLEITVDRQEVIEQYRQGNLFQVGDVVESLTTGMVGRIHHCGANHLICVTDNGIMFKDFVYEVILV